MDQTWTEYQPGLICVLILELNLHATDVHRFTENVPQIPENINKMDPNLKFNFQNS